jgi:predicted Zn-dependent peptidase
MPGSALAHYNLAHSAAQRGDLAATEAELRRALTHAEADFEFSYETADGRARRLGRAETVWRVEEEVAYVDRLRSVTREQIRAAARRYLDPQQYARVTFVPGPRP